jgi:transposase-like protein
MVSAAQRWRSIVEQQRQSGLGVSEFCRQRSIATSSFFAWRKKLTRPGQGPRPGGTRRRGGSGDPSAFAAVKIIAERHAATATAAIELRLRGGRRLLLRSGFDAELLRQAVRVLEDLS